MPALKIFMSTKSDMRYCQVKILVKELTTIIEIVVKSVVRVNGSLKINGHSFISWRYQVLFYTCARASVSYS